jgi:hypothetical protein
MNHAYNTYGIPTLEILCECSKENLNIFEKEAFIIFDCIDNGLDSSTLVKVLNKKPRYKSHKGWKLKE